MEVRLESLVIGYRTRKGERHVLSPLSITLPEGRLLCIVGRNGVGKSTLLRTLAGLQPPISGHIYVDGTRMEEYSTVELARKVSIVTTHNHFADRMSVHDVVSLGRSPYTGFWGTLTDIDLRRVNESIAAVGIEQLSRRNVNSLSDGERQKVMIAKAIAQDTPVILLDEPTAFLDYPSKVQTLSLLARLAKDMARTIIVSTHDVEHALRLSNDVWLLQKEGLYEVLRRDTLVLNHTTDSFCKKIGNGDLLDLGTALGVGDGVGEDNLLKSTVLHTL